VAAKRSAYRKRRPRRPGNDAVPERLVPQVAGRVSRSWIWSSRWTTSSGRFTRGFWWRRKGRLRALWGKRGDRVIATTGLFSSLHTDRRSHYFLRSCRYGIAVIRIRYLIDDQIETNVIRGIG